MRGRRDEVGANLMQVGGERNGDGDWALFGWLNMAWDYNISSAQQCFLCIFLLLILQTFLPKFSRWVCSLCSGDAPACDSKAGSWVFSWIPHVQTKAGYGRCLAN